MFELKQHNTQVPFAVVAVIFLLGLLLGGLYVGIVAPLRTVIQADFGIDSQTGIWIINIYTLFYAATIPISGNLADRFGRSRVFVVCLCLFSLGSLICALTQTLNSFVLLLFGRIVQALGAGGVIPVATAEIGVSAPQKSRGMWLGLAAAVSGLANVVGAALGSAMISLFGAAQWSLVFLVALPLGLLLALAGFICLPRAASKKQGGIDIPGSICFVAAMLCLLFGLQGVDVSKLFASVLQLSVWLPLLAAVCLFVLFFYLEKQAANPLFDTEFLKQRQVVIIMLVSLLVGGIIISMTFVPEFAEGVLGVEVGSGGYYMSVIGVFAIVGPPVCGKLVDKWGAKRPLMGGLLVTSLGFVFLALVVASYPSVATMLIGLAIVGLGMGFSMGTPLNYMILQNAEEEKSTAAVASVALVRQIGTTLAPSLLASFCAGSQSGASYGSMMLMVALFGALSIILLCFYREVR